MSEREGQNPPTRAPGDPIALDYPRLFAATGLPQEYNRPDIIEGHIQISTTVEFSDGEFVGLHLPILDPVLQQHFGTSHYGKGTFGKRLRELFEGTDVTMQQQVDRLVRDAGAQLARLTCMGVLPPSFPSVTVDVERSMLEFDTEHSVPLAAPPEVVLDYGPGLRGQHHIDRQILDMRDGGRPYTYVAITKGPLISSFLREYWIQRFGGNQEIIEHVAPSLYINREDGMASATTALIEFEENRGRSTEAADVVIASGVHRAGAQELSVGIANAYKLLRPEGVLLVRAPKQIEDEPPDTVAARDIVAMAHAAGFVASRSQFFDVTTGGGFTIAPVTQSLSAVFRK